MNCVQCRLGGYWSLPGARGQTLGAAQTCTHYLTGSGPNGPQLSELGLHCPVMVVWILHNCQIQAPPPTIQPVEPPSRLPHSTPHIPVCPEKPPHCPNSARTAAAASATRASTKMPDHSVRLTGPLNCTVKDLKAGSATFNVKENAV